MKKIFTIIKQKKNMRRGTLSLIHGTIQTPFFMPIATRAAVKNISPQEIKALGAEIILSNTYHLYQRPGLPILKKHKGLHSFMAWDKPILTDSGGFQVFSLSHRRKITDHGVQFRSEIDGREISLTPESVIDAQLTIGSDIIMVLDECPPWPATKKYAEQSLERTLLWARRSKIHFEKRTRGLKKRPLLFGIVQGSTFKDLRIKSAKELVAIGFDGYAIGGVSVGEPFKEKLKVLEWALPYVPKDKPRYLMGLGKPEEIAAAVERGVDMFDCVIPTREARHGRLYIFNPKFKKKDRKITGKNFYTTININNAQFAEDLTPPDKRCSCPACAQFTKAYLHHLFKTQESFGQRLSSLHNVRFFIELMERLRLIQ
jgi:queuine tRNA-ribosyltransferase